MIGGQADDEPSNKVYDIERIKQDEIAWNSLSVQKVNVTIVEILVCMN